MNGQAIVTLRLVFKPGTIDRVLSELLPIARQTRQEDGNIAFDVYRAVDQPDTLILFERWEDRALLEHHR